MSEQVGFRCLSCGDGFVINVLDKDEARERRRLHLPVGPVRCPQCESTNVERIRRAA
jgi:DNA-directed RNA polymerase subunit RPC12/RpoP